jgi:glycosyltransferase involved in cell wall biosynthesis
MKKKNILMYTPFLKIGGVEAMAIQYSHMLTNAGHRVDILVDYDLHEGNTLSGKVPVGARVMYVKPYLLSKFIYWFRGLSKRNPVLIPLLISIIVTSDFIFHYVLKYRLRSYPSYDITLTFFQFLGNHLANIYPNSKNIIWFHGSVKHFFKDSFYSTLLYKAYSKKLTPYDQIVTVSKEISTEISFFLPNVPKSKVECIYNPLDFDYLRTASLDDSALSPSELDLIKSNYICHVSRLDENQKDVASLIRAFSLLTDIENLNLVIIGDGQDKAKLEKIVNRHSLSNKVHFLGAKENPHIWVKNAMLSILSSKYEGFGLVLVEAMAVRTYVISSDCDVGPREILGNGSFGDLFKVGDSEALASLIRKRILDRHYVNDICSLYDARVQEFSEQNAMSSLERII